MQPKRTDYQPPRYPEEIQEHLSDIREIKTKLEQRGLKDAADQFRFRSLTDTEGQLLSELSAAQLLLSNEDIELGFSGSPVQGSAVTAAFLASILSGVQKLVDLISVGVKHMSLVGEQISEKVLHQSQLMVTALAPGSFTVIMRLPDPEGAGEAFAMDRREKVLSCLGELFDDNALDTELTELVIKYGAKKAYRNLLGNVQGQKGELRLRTKINPYGTILTPVGAKKRIKWMSQSERESAILELRGQFMGGSLASRKFELKVGDDIYDGPVSPEAYEQMIGLQLGDKVKTTVEETRKYHKQAQIKAQVQHRLMSIFKVLGT